MRTRSAASSVPPLMEIVSSSNIQEFSEDIQLVCGPEPDSTIRRTLRGSRLVHGSFDRHAHRIGKQLVGVTAGDLDQAPAAKAPAITGCGVAVAQPVRIHGVGELFGCPSAGGSRGFGGKAGGPDDAETGRAVIQIFFKGLKPFTFDSALAEKGANAVRRDNTGPLHRHGERLRPGGGLGIRQTGCDGLHPAYETSRCGGKGLVDDRHCRRHGGRQGRRRRLAFKAGQS